ncbi:MAG TPA: GNAT family N-acetyltransferase [Steroidobacteraceae bacterium]|nr:GNAT family N-acetyltransferase [Steroidobacteraceae bacterium]
MMSSTDGRAQRPAIGEPMDSNSGAHPLDHVIWRALTSCHRDVADGDDLALRYLAPIAPFAATTDVSTASFQSLLALLPAGDRIGLFTLEEMMPPASFSVIERAAVDQMVLVKMPSYAGRVPIVELDASDVPDMLALVEATHPGPFGPRTIELGQYIGVRRQGMLVAMAGERMRLDGFTEISAVCVHPSCRGQGLAAELVSTLARSIASRAETSFLHVFNSNRPAIELYRKLGFVLRRHMHLAVLARASGEPE